MILGFKPQFKEKILSGSKIHTIRIDKNNRWKVGTPIQFATGVRTKKYDCFMQGECKAIQNIIIKRNADTCLWGFWICDKAIVEPSKDMFNPIFRHTIEKLYKNDGFENFREILNFFFPPKKKSKKFIPDKADILNAKIIHWTDFKY